MRRPLVVLLTVVATTLALAALPACSGGGGGDTLTIYSGRTKNLIDPLLADFAKETGTDIEVRYGDSADLALLVDREGDKSPADVFLSQSPGAIDFLSGQDRLTALPPGLLDMVEPRFRSEDGTWVGLSGRVRTLVYNTDDVAAGDLPASVFDLTDPKYAGKLAVAPSNGSFQDFVTAMRADVGDQATLAWLKGIKDNGAKTYANNTAIVQAVGRGEVAMGLVNHYYNEQAKAQDPGLASENHFFAAGDLGNLILATGVGVLDTAGDPTAAQRFVEFMLGRQAQEYFATETLEYPLASGVAAPPGLPPLSSIQAPRQDLSGLGDLAATAKLIQESGLASG